MSIICQICNTEFKKIIPWQHLKTHSIDSKEYRKLHGSLYSPEVLEKHKTRIPHNKGKQITDAAQLKKLREAIDLREERFRRGEIVRGSKKTQEQKELLSKKSKEYAAQHKSELKERAAKAKETKINNGFDFGSPMRGKNHSAKTKEKLRLSREAANEKKSSESHSRIINLLEQYNFTLTNSLSSNLLNLCCNICHTNFSFTKQYFTPSKTWNQMCPGCFPRSLSKSQAEIELFDFIVSICPDAVSGYRPHYHDKEIDVYVPSKNIGFEYNGLYWHSEDVLIANGKDPTADYKKHLYFKEKEIRIIGIFSDEWFNQNDIVKSRIRNILGVTEKKFYARKCTIKQVSSSDAAMFCQQNHIMGRGRSNIRLGLYLDNTLVSLMTFVKSNLSRKSTSWEINRFAHLKNTTVVGGASKLFKEFVKMINPETVISYADTRWSDGNLYKSLGFSKTSSGTPNYWYFLPNTGCRIHRFTLRKTIADNPLLTEYQNRKNQGYSRIWDYGSSRWSWKPHKNEL
jgi:protein-arginine kinase activator protein McsA